MNDLTAAIIAGGKSTRFGAPKCEVEILGKTLLENAMDIALQVTSRVMVISGERTIPVRDGISVYPDVTPGRGPLGGIYTALLHTTTPYLLTLPCDVPLLPAAVLRQLTRYISSGRPVVAVSHKGLEPLVAVWPREALPTVQQCLETGRLSLREPLHQLQAVEVVLPREMKESYQPEYFLNINTRADLQMLFSFLERQGMYETI